MSKSGAVLIRGAAGRSMAMVVNFAITMVLLPIVVSNLGDRLYGAWIMVGMVIGYYGLLDLGLSSAVSRFVSRALGQDNKEEADCFITTSIYLFSIAGLIGFVIIIAQVATHSQKSFTA